jgi:methylmalonyl-CoA/ethylmalonyl-CoA epimerase
MEHARDLELPGRLRASFYSFGQTQTQVELIDIIEPQERARRLGSHKSRLEHIAIEVDDLGFTHGILARLGVRTQTIDPVPIGSNMNYWTVAETSGGVMYQLVEKH